MPICDLGLGLLHVEQNRHLRGRTPLPFLCLLFAMGRPASAAMGTFRHEASSSDSGLINSMVGLNLTDSFIVIPSGNLCSVIVLAWSSVVYEYSSQYVNQENMY